MTIAIALAARFRPLFDDRMVWRLGQRGTFGFVFQTHVTQFLIFRMTFEGIEEALLHEPCGGFIY